MNWQAILVCIGIHCSEVCTLLTHHLCCSVHLQPFVTDRLVLRGQYQTVPIAVYGYALSSVGAAAEQPAPSRITLADALRRLPAGGTAQAVVMDSAHLSGTGTRPASAPAAAATGLAEGAGLMAGATGPPFRALPPHAAHALQQLVAYWRVVGMSERAMAAQPPPAIAMQAATAAANFMCDQLLAVAASPSAASAAARQTRQAGGPMLAIKHEAHGDGPGAAAPAAAAAAMGAAEAGGGEAAQLPDWVADAADMAVGWCALLGSGATGRTAHALECGSAGLAAAVLLCGTPGSAAQFLARHGVLLLADVLTWPRAPATFVRHALAAGLLCVLSCGALGCEALLGWWKPAKGLACDFKVGSLCAFLPMMF
jgi:hypothetical protein